ncbi:MAG TPA: NADP-dependent oxidoreductase [Actinomycetes bacterium]
MNAVRLHPPGGIGNLAVEEVAVPSPGEGEALVRVHAAAITRDELDWPTDRLPAIPSYELSGVVEQLGDGVAELSPGDAVFALTGFDRDGVAAELAVVPAAVLAPKPKALGHVESAALPMGGLTAWQGLFDHGGLEPGQRVLVLGARGGVGHLAVQLARARGAEVVEQPGEPVDLVFDTAGGEPLRRAPALVRPGGRLVSVAEEPPPSDASSYYFVVEPNRGQLVELARLADDGALVPAVDSVFPLAEARAAFERVMARGKRGKVVLRVVEG